jgi:glycosyltransferase involved in cell wall biosynthesis
MVHFISNYTKKQSLFGNRTNFVIIPNTSHFEPYVETVNLKISKGDTIDILIVRSIEERARFDLLLQVAEQLCDGKYKFIVAGKGPLLTHYQKEIQDKELHNIELLGYVGDTDLLNLYFNCDIVLMIAEYGEGFGLPIIEGYLFNKPVIASNKCAIPEVIISKDYLFENNVESIIKSIEYASNIQNENYADYFESHFSNSIVLSKFRNLYSNIHS